MTSARGIDQGRHRQQSAHRGRVATVLHRLTPRPFRISIGARILAGFGLTAALAAAVAMISLLYNEQAGRRWANVTERDGSALVRYLELETAVEQQTGGIQNFLLSGDDRDLDVLNAGRARFDAALADLGRNLPSSQGSSALTDIQRRAQEMDELAQDVLTLHRQGWRQSSNFLWRTDGIPKKAGLIAAINEQVDLHNTVIEDEVQRSREHLRFALGLAFGLVSLAAVTALVIGMTITRAVTSPVKSLMQLATAVQRDDYSQRAPVTGEDELATLSATMNAMVESLAVSRAQLEHALSETERSEEKYRLLAENASDIIVTLDRDNRVTFINPVVQRILGYQPEELIGQPVATVMTEETSRHLNEQAGWVTREPYRLTEDLELLAKDGRIVPVEVNTSVLRVNGKAIGVLGLVRDMTERNRMERELRRLHTKERRRADQLLTVNEAGRKIAALQSVEMLLPSLVQTVGKTFGYRHVRILLQGDDRPLTVAANWERTDGSPAPAGAGGGGAVVVTAAEPPAADADDDMPLSPLVLRALEGDAGFVAGSGRPEDDIATRYTEVAVPVRTKTDVLGVLDIRADADDGLDDSDIFTLQTLSDQIAVAIENARLYEAGQQLAVSEERNRLARELHDSVTQELFSMTMMASALPALMERRPEAARERVTRLQELARGALSEMRALLFALRPAALAEEGLVSAVTKHAAGFESREGIKVLVEISGDGRLPQPCEEALYRVMQEGMNNVVKHARATTIWLSLTLDDHHAALTIRDDGAGLPTDLAATETGMGMRTMRERISALGGDFRVESRPGGGVTLVAALPTGISDTPASLPDGDTLSPSISSSV